MKKEILNEFNKKWNRCNCDGGFDSGQCTETNGKYKCNSTLIGEKKWELLRQNISKYFKDKLK